MVIGSISTKQNNIALNSLVTPKIWSCIHIMIKEAAAILPEYKWCDYAIDIKPVKYHHSGHVMH
jgi:hypothetical protein